MSNLSRDIRCPVEFQGLLLLTLSWSLGACIGYLLSLHSSEVYISLMYNAPLVRVSIVGLLFVAFLPLLLSIWAVYCSVDFLIYILAFLKSFSFVFAGCCVYSAYANAGWLIDWFLLFSTSISAIPLFWFWCRSFVWGKRFLKRDCIFCIGITIAVAGLDYFTISRFLQSLFYH